MGRYTGPLCKLCRRRGEKLYLKNERCFSSKCSFSRRSYVPGVSGPKRRRAKKMSDYSIRLNEKQKARQIYGMGEKQFRKFFMIASRKKGITGENLLKLLEFRLDNFVYRVGFAVSRFQARQFVRHGHILVNSKKVNIPSYILKVNDEIAIGPTSQKMFKDTFEVVAKKKMPPYCSFDKEKKTAKLLTSLNREDIDVPVDEQLIVEYYSR